MRIRVISNHHSILRASARVLYFDRLEADFHASTWAIERPFALFAVRIVRRVMRTCNSLLQATRQVDVATTAGGRQWRGVICKTEGLTQHLALQ